MRKTKTKTIAETNPETESENQILSTAIGIAERRMRYSGKTVMNDPSAVRDWARLYFATLDPSREHFVIAMLNSRHRFITAEVLFSGGVDGCEIQAGVVVKKALLTPTCAACIVFHNHPSGHPEPSAADHQMTARLKQSLGLVDIRLLDHFVVAESITSFAERGWL